MKNTSSMRIVMFPWFAFGHMTPFLNLANKLAERGCTITLMLPSKAIPKLHHFNRYQECISYVPIKVPSVDGLPVGTEMASEIPNHMSKFLIMAVDRTRDQVEKVLRDTRANVVIFDSLVCWTPQLSKPLGVKSIYYCVVCPYGSELVLPSPSGSEPSSSIILQDHEAETISLITRPLGDGTTFQSRIMTAMTDCDVIATRTFREFDYKSSDFIARAFGKKVFMLGAVLPEIDETPLEERWSQWLSQFEQGSVVYCAFGSEDIVEKQEFQNIVLGLEMTGLPFLMAMKAPKGASTIEEALPDGFQERVKCRGMVWSGWMPQVKILEHPSIGCSVTHCGYSSIWESLMNDVQIVMVPKLFDDIFTAKLLGHELKVAVEVVKDDNGWVSKENLCEAIKSVMDKDSQVGAFVKRNRLTFRDVLFRQGYMDSYIDKFVQGMQELVV